MYNHQLDTFIKAAECGSFGKAAEELYISVPAVIQQINILESSCGFKLFNRSNQGIQLTAAGKSLYDDAKTLIKSSVEAINRASAIANGDRNSVRIGTSLLFKCRLLPDLWVKASQVYPDLKIEIIPIPDKQSREESISDLGNKYDIREGVFSTISQKEKCGFLKLADTPICCAVSKGHRLASYDKLTLEDLNGEYIVMPIMKVSEELDAFRREICERYPTVKIIDSSYYGMDTFIQCEINSYVLIAQPVYADITSNLIMIPLETDYVLPYGLMYSKTPSAATKKFMDAVRNIMQGKNTKLIIT